MTTTNNCTYFLRHIRSTKSNSSETAAIVIKLLPERRNYLIGRDANSVDIHLDSKSNMISR